MIIAIAKLNMLKKCEFLPSGNVETCWNTVKHSIKAFNANTVPFAYLCIL